MYTKANYGRSPNTSNRQNKKRKLVISPLCNLFLCIRISFGSSVLMEQMLNGNSNAFLVFLLFNLKLVNLSSNISTMIHFLFPHMKIREILVTKDLSLRHVFL